MSTRNVTALDRVLRAARGPAWGLLDQAVYSGTNFLAVVLVARALGADAFGAFALALSVWATVWVLARSVIAEPFIIRTAALPEDEWRVEASHAAGVLTAAGAATAIGVGVAALFLFGGSLGPTLLVLAPFIPVLLLQDFWRVAAFSRDDGRLAFVNDLAWAVVQVAALLLLWAINAFTSPTAMVAWGLGGFAGMLVGFWQFRLWPHLSRSTGPWMRETLRLGGWLGVARGIQTAGTNLAFVLVGAVAGLPAVGTLRAVYALFGPVATVSRSMQLPALAQMSAADHPTRDRAVWSYALILSGSAAAFSIVAVLGGDGLITAVYGESFSEAMALLLPMAIVFVASGASSSLSLGLGAMQAVRLLAAIETASTALRLGLTLLLATSGGAQGAAIGLAIHAGLHVLFVATYYVKIRNRQLTPWGVAAQVLEERPNG